MVTPRGALFPPQFARRHVEQIFRFCDIRGRMAFPSPPAKIIPFKVAAIPPHDIERQFDEQARSITRLIEFLRRIVRDDGLLRNGLIGPEQLSPEFSEEISRSILQEAQAQLLAIKTQAALASLAAAETQAASAEIRELASELTREVSLMKASNERVQRRLVAWEQQANQAPPQVSSASTTPSLPTGILGPNVGGPFGVDPLGAAATAQDWSQVSIDWAEHMPDTIPPNTLSISQITGDHWSSRWWANRSANAFGMLAWWYQGAWAFPGPPSTPNTPTGQPLPPGSMYWDTTHGIMMVWNGSTWVSASAPAKGATASLYYLAAANQTVFPFSTADRAGHTFAFNQTTPEGCQAYVNGVRLEPTYDFTIDTVGSSVTFLRPLVLNSIVTFDLLTPATQLTPSGTVNTVLVTPIVPDGVKTAFTGLTVASNGHPLSVAKNEELLVSVDGVQQSPGGSYTASGATITFTEAPASTAIIFIVWFGPANP
jgi:hypothetical protein